MILFNISDDSSGAKFSDCRAYRYLLWRKWDGTKPFVGFIGLNPSTANETQADPTIRKVKKFAKMWGFGGVYMMNLFPFVTPYPECLIECEALHLAINDQIISEIGGKCGKIIFAWGAFKQAEERGRIMAGIFPDAEALVVNNDGSPRHPLYVPYKTTPVKFLQ